MLEGLKRKISFACDVLKWQQSGHILIPETETAFPEHSKGELRLDLSEKNLKPKPFTSHRAQHANLRRTNIMN
jgi:hypothetical protein